MLIDSVADNSLLNEKDLLLRVAEGDEIAFRQLFDSYRPKLFTYLLRLSESREIAEDNVHDVFLKLWTNRLNLPAIENLSAYLYRMAHNHAFNGLRRMATETLVLAELKQLSVSQPEDPGAGLYRKEVRQFIQDSVARLTPKQREVFVLSRELGLKQAEIAERMGITVSTVKSHLTDALNALRTEISIHYGPNAVALFVLWNLAY